MTTRQELQRALDGMTDEQLRAVLAVIDEVRGGATRDRATDGPTDLSQFYGVLELREDPAVYQERSRDEWP